MNFLLDEIRRRQPDAIGEHRERTYGAALDSLDARVVDDLAASAFAGTRLLGDFRRGRGKPPGGLVRRYLLREMQRRPELWSTPAAEDTPSDEARFFQIYQRLSELQHCDATGGLEYRRVLDEWKLAGRPPDLDSFITIRANWPAHALQFTGGSEAAQ